MSEEEASKAYSRLDSGNTDAVTLDQFASSRPEHGRPEGTTSSRTMSAVFELQRGGGRLRHESAEGGNGAKPASLADAYKDMDIDGSGSVSKAEFLAARPDRMSEKQAASVYNAIDTQGTGSISEEQFENAFKKHGDAAPAGEAPAAPPADVPDAVAAPEDETAAV